MRDWTWQISSRLAPEGRIEVKAEIIGVGRPMYGVPPVVVMQGSVDRETAMLRAVVEGLCAYLDDPRQAAAIEGG